MDHFDLVPHCRDSVDNLAEREQADINLARCHNSAPVRSSPA